MKWNFYEKHNKNMDLIDSRFIWSVLHQFVPQY